MVGYRYRIDLERLDLGTDGQVPVLGLETGRNLPDHVLASLQQAARPLRAGPLLYKTHHHLSHKVVKVRHRTESSHLELVLTK